MKVNEKVCPRCAEAVKLEAVVCKHCGHEFSAAELESAKAKQSKQSKDTLFGCLGCGGLIAAAILALGYCTMSDPDPDMTITAANVEGAWPAKPAKLRVDCGNRRSTVFVESEGRAYPINGTAKTFPDTYSGDLPVAADDAAIAKPLDGFPGLRQPFDLVISAAIERCRQAGLWTER